MYISSLKCQFASQSSSYTPLELIHLVTPVGCLGITDLDRDREQRTNPPLPHHALSTLRYEILWVKDLISFFTWRNASSKMIFIRPSPWPTFSSRSTQASPFFQHFIQILRDRSCSLNPSVTMAPATYLPLSTVIASPFCPHTYVASYPSNLLTNFCMSFLLIGPILVLSIISFLVCLFSLFFLAILHPQIDNTCKVWNLVIALW